MSISVNYRPLSLVDLFRIGEICAYDYDNDVLLATSDGASNRLLHLYENEVEGRTMYGLNVGSVIEMTDQPCFVGTLVAVEVSFVANDTAWDFLSLTLAGSGGLSLEIRRNNDSFPEPTFSRTK